MFINDLYYKNKENGNENEKNLKIPPFLEQLFGKKNYKYRLAIRNDLPQTLYKERNFNMDIILLDAFGNPVKNSNLIPLYFAVCTNHGEWIH